MNEQNNNQRSIENSESIQQNRVTFDQRLLASKKDLIEEFLRSEEDESDTLLNYPSQSLQKVIAAQLKERGKLQFYRSVSTLYLGETCNELYHGYGLLIYKGGSLRFYEGSFQNNCKYGYGLECIGGDTYFGRFVNNKPEDEGGVFAWGNGDLYLGGFVNGMKHGQGKWQSGAEFYSGTWKYNKPEGEGFIRSALSEYRGEVRNGYKHGRGREAFGNGDSYEGNYSNGKPEGSGAYFWSNGAAYRGEFKNGLRFGQGTWELGAEQYEGAYVNDKRNGKGRYSWGGGSYYVGGFVEDLRHGYGQMHWGAESFYRGEWFEGAQSGEGEVWEGGRLVEKGEYEGGKLKGRAGGEGQPFLPLNSLGKKASSLNSHSFPEEHRRFNSFQAREQESVKLDSLKNQRTANQLSPSKNEEKLTRLREVSKRYSAIANRGLAQQPVSKSFRAGKNVELRMEEKSEEKDERGKMQINKINLYRRLRKEKQSDPLSKKPAVKLPKSMESELFFETQLAPIKWKNFNHISQS